MESCDQSGALGAATSHYGWLWRQFRATGLFIAQWGTPSHLLPELVQQIARLVLTLLCTQHVHLVDETLPNRYHCYDHDFSREFVIFIDDVVARRIKAREYGALYDVHCIVYSGLCDRQRDTYNNYVPYVALEYACPLRHAGDLLRVLDHMTPRSFLWVKCKRSVPEYNVLERHEL